MYAIYANIYHQYTPVLLAYIYIPYMDPMGYSILQLQNAKKKKTAEPQRTGASPFRPNS